MITKKNIVQHSLTAILSAGLVIIYFLFTKNSSNSSFLASSERIPLDTALKYREHFDNLKPLRVTPTGVFYSDPEKTEPLEGFVFNASDLYEIVRENHSGLTPNEVIFYFGQDGEAGPSTDRHGVIHIIAIGRKNNKLLIKDKDTVRNEPSIFDKADPCPPFCGTIKTE